MKVFCVDCKYISKQITFKGSLCCHESNIVEFDYVNRNNTVKDFCKDININGECKNYSESRPPVKP